MSKENTLLLGNGFSKSIFENIPCWEDLFEGAESTIKNYTILYEVYLLKQNNAKVSEDSVKSDLIKKIGDAFLNKEIKGNICGLNEFGRRLAAHNIYNIITTNYDEGIEFILCEKCGYEEKIPEELIKEEIYSIRTYKKFVNKNTGHEVKLWKIHGDLKRIKSITLGFDQYCGSISKLSGYIKGTYKSEKGPECKSPMTEKCRKQDFDSLSWAELFFNTNIYIVGLGMDFSEIDIWWLLNKHMRIKKGNKQVQNNIYYLYNKEYDVPEEKKDIFEALKAFGVEYRGIISDRNYIENIFREIAKT